MITATRFPPSESPEGLFAEVVDVVNIGADVAWYYGLLVSEWCDVRCGLMPIVDGDGDETIGTLNEQREGSNSQDGKHRPQVLHR